MQTADCVTGSQDRNRAVIGVRRGAQLAGQRGYLLLGIEANVEPADMAVDPVPKVVLRQVERECREPHQIPCQLPHSEIIANVELLEGCGPLRPAIFRHEPTRGLALKVGITGGVDLRNLERLVEIRGRHLPAGIGQRRVADCSVADSPRLLAHM